MSTNIIKWIVTRLLFSLPSSSAPPSPCHRSIVIACELIPLPPPRKGAKKLLKGSTRVEEFSCCHTTIPAFLSLLFDKGHNVSVAIKSISSVTSNDKTTSVQKSVESRCEMKWQHPRNWALHENRIQKWSLTAKRRVSWSSSYPLLSCPCHTTRKATGIIIILGAHEAPEEVLQRCTISSHVRIQHESRGKRKWINSDMQWVN